MTSNGIRWEDPPDGNASRAEWRTTIDQLRERLNIWALVYEPLNGEPPQQTYNKAQGLRTYAGRHGIKIETRCRKGDDGVIRVYARRLP